MIFEYKQEQVFTQTLQIDDIGNMAICCKAQKDTIEYYLMTKTILGKTAIIRFGPLMADVDSLQENFELSFKRIDYKESSIVKEVSKFINDYRRNITDIEVISEYEVFDKIPTANIFESSI